MSDGVLTTWSPIVTCYHMLARTSAAGAFADAYRQACESTDGHALVHLFKSEPAAYAALHTELAGVDIPSLCAQIQLTSVPQAQAKRLVDLASAYLEYARMDDRKSASIAAYDAWATVFARAVAVFTLDVPWFSPALKYVGNVTVELAVRSDKGGTHGKMVDAAGRLSKCAALSANDRTPGRMAETKRVNALALANLSFRAYLRLRNTRLCETVLGSVQNALQMNIRHDGLDESATGEEGYPMSERVMFHYYIGRIRLAYGRVTVAAQHLRWAFDRCPKSSRHNRRIIAIPLTCAYIILGRYPTHELLTECNLVDQFGTLVHCMRLGHGAGVLAELLRHRDWLRFQGLYGLLSEKLLLGTWRNLFRRCLLLEPATETNAPPILRLSTVLVAARYAWQDPYLTADDVECFAANLIDQGLIKAYILHAKGIMVLQKGAHRGFVQPASVYLR